MARKNSQNKDGGSSTRRRNFLRLVGGAAAISSAPTSVAGKVGSGPSPSVTISVRRDREDPMSLERANALMKRAVSQFRDETGSEEGIGYSQEESSEKTDVYALTFHIDGKGRPASYIGSTYSGPKAKARDDPGSVKQLHRNADRFEARATDSVTNVTQFGNEDSVSAAGLNNDWQVFETSERESITQWGVLKTNMSVGYYVYNDDDEPKTTHFRTFSFHRNNPGVNQYTDSNYHQNNGRMEHDYGSGLSAELGRYAPTGNKTGSYTYSGSISAGVDGASLGIGASYSPTNVSRLDESDDVRDRAVWDWSYNPKLLWDGATQNPDTFEPSSLASTKATPEQDDRIVTVDRSADWFNPRAGVTSPNMSYVTLIRYDAP